MKDEKRGRERGATEGGNARSYLRAVWLCPPSAASNLWQASERVGKRRRGGSGYSSEEEKAPCRTADELIMRHRCSTNRRSSSALRSVRGPCLRSSTSHGPPGSCHCRSRVRSPLLRPHWRFFVAKRCRRLRLLLRARDPQLQSS
ncbi:unnamed protein product [Pleuronectes platessa]|uniref:Uncharacterized protein n=1 Tax=Pleuronectes platessa TaxID=8262 RepID=A0A9N7V7R4_PLEPL|nr:unnamed protein product [Pleuronectes platessa]